MLLVDKHGVKYQLVVGLEIHAQIKTPKKLFSPSANDFSSSANSNISNFDIAIPGSLPVLNMDAITPVIRAGLAVNAKINNKSHFDRKNYFYPDLPSGYQITQFYKPIVENGYLDITIDGTTKRIGIERIHIEQDAGKSIHDAISDKTCLDFNRAGVGLMEIVSRPDIRSTAEAAAYIKKLRAILKTVEASEADMDAGSFRVDANVSIMPIGSDKFGTRCEIKNLNSISFIETAIEIEARRQLNIIESGQKVEQETRLFDPNKNETRSMRKKENANDYKYFPDPDLPALIINQDLIDNLAQNMPELPDAKTERYVKYGIVPKEAKIIAEDFDLSKYFDEVASKHDPKTAYSWVAVELLGRLNKEQIEIKNCIITPSLLIGLLDAIKSGVINGKIAKVVMDEMFDAAKAGRILTAEEVIKSKGLEQVDNNEEIIAAVKTVLANNEQQLASYRNGNQKLFGFFVGEVMKATKGKANPSKVNEILKDEIQKI